MKKIPYGIIDYKTLKEENYEYVDKTMYLSELEDIGRTLIYLRPGRFGKSLFTSMMYYYYDVNSESLFKSLFKNTYVYENPTKNKNNYYILKFDFSGITTADKEGIELENEFKNKVILGINKCLSTYNFNFSIESFEGDTPNQILARFLSFIDSLKLEHKLYILVDEYDNFTNAILSGEARRFKNIVGNEGFVKAFYAQIKEYVGLGVIDRVFITGICPITMDSMTTGFNIATDISTDEEFASMIGLTHNEVLNLMSDIKEEERSKVYDLMIENYDGYLFSKRSKERVFNATLTMYCLKEWERFERVPDELIDKNIVVNYGKIENLVKLQNNEFYHDIIDSLLNKEEIEGTLKTSFNLEADFTKDDIISLLYYFGYLTIKKEEYGSTTFKIPNYIMKETYFYYFLKLLNEQKITIDTSRRVECIKEIVEEKKINKLSEYVSDILSKMDNRGFLNLNERTIENIYFTTLLGNSELDIRDEFPCLNGYVDLLIEPKRNKEYKIMIELKYIKKSEYNDILLERKKKEAKEQLKMYASDERNKTNMLKKYVVIFVSSEVKLIEEV